MRVKGECKVLGDPISITESMKYWTVLDLTPIATMGLYQRRAEILRSAQNDKHFLLSLLILSYLA